MKRTAVFLLALLLLLLCGCGQPADPPGTVPSPPVEPDWLLRCGTPWDRDGALVELTGSFAVMGSMSTCTEFDGDLLSWSYDIHLADGYVLEMMLTDLVSGTVLAQRDITLQSYIIPQPLGDSLYLCDNTGGTVYQLDKSLQDVRQWQVEPGESTWYMGGQHKLYQLTEDSHLWVRDLEDGTFEPLIPEDPEVWVMSSADGTASLEYYHPDTGINQYAALDLATGRIIQPETAQGFSTISLAGDTWFTGKYTDGYTFYLGSEDAAPRQFSPGEGYFQLLKDGYLLGQSSDGMYLHLYDLDGHAISSCQLSENGTYYASTLIRSEYHNGYFLIAYGDDGYSRLLFWDTEVPAATEDLTFTAIPAPSADEAALLQRCEEIGTKYGLAVIIGEGCDTEFMDFTATVTTDWAKISAGLDILEDALTDYPEGFFRQLHYGTVHGVRIQLVSDLQANGSGRTGGGYTAFVQNMWDHALMVVDIDAACQETYYHEFSHVIDLYLDWDSIQREDALYSEEGWSNLNPDWFPGYTYDYSNEVYLDDFRWFIDPYATISPTEDRARVMEYAMAEYGYWNFAESRGLQQKLDYYCRCIRDAFDTALWPETVLWEQYR